MSPASLIAPLAALAVLGVAGVGVAGLLAPRASRDGQAALAPLVTAAILFITSPVLLLGTPPLALAATVLGLLIAVGIGRRRQSVAVARQAAVPAVLACLAVALYAGPALKHGTWAASTMGNQDAYVWVSQAQSLEHGTPKGPAATTPDRVPHDRLFRDAWPTAIPGGLAELSTATRIDPVDGYGLLSALIGAMLALGVFYGGRGALRWSTRRSAVAAAIVSLNGLMLLSSFYGWQAQLLLTTMGSLLVLMLPACFERGSDSMACAGPSLFGAAAISIYGWTAAPFVIVAAAVCVASTRRNGREACEMQHVARRVGLIALLTALIGVDAISRAVITLARGTQHASPAVLSIWNQFDWAFPSDALGFVPRTPHDAPGVGWELLAGSVASVLVIRGFRWARSLHNPRGLTLATAGLMLVFELVALLVSGASPYTTLKLMAYSTPLLTLLVIGARVTPSRPRGRIAGLIPFGTALVNVVAACLFLTTTAVAIGTGLAKTRPATEVLPAARAAVALPSGKVIRIAVDDTWNQVWLVYFLRDRPVAVPSPSVAFVGYSAKDAAKARRFDAQADFVIRELSPGPALWHDNKFGIYAIKKSPHA